MRKKLINLLKMKGAGDMNIVYFNGQFLFFSDKEWYLPASTEKTALESIEKHLKSVRSPAL
jgi:hypothetical protein